MLDRTLQLALVRFSQSAPQPRAPRTARRASTRHDRQGDRTLPETSFHVRVSQRSAPASSNE
jgi:hypothetical protein